MLDIEYYLFVVFVGKRVPLLFSKRLKHIHRKVLSSQMCMCDTAVSCSTSQCVVACYIMLQCVVVCCSVLQCVVAVCCCSVLLQCVVACYIMLQCVVVCCSALQCVVAVSKHILKHKCSQCYSLTNDYNTSTAKSIIYMLDIRYYRISNMYVKLGSLICCKWIAQEYRPTHNH